MVFARVRSALAVLGLSVVLAACGGGGGASGATGSSSGGSSGGGGTTATAPTISTQPQSQTVATGAAVTFTVATAGTTPITYQWNRNGTAISGATGASYTTPAVVIGDSGVSFTVIASNSAGQITSSAATLTVQDPATITTQPQAQTAVTGDTATFSVVATGTALSYQWKKNGAAINGATSASYTTPAVALSDTGTSFTVVVNNTASSVTSSAAILSANADPEGLYLGSVHYTSGNTFPAFAIVLKDGTAAAFVTESVVPVNAPIGYSLHGLALHPTGATFTSTYVALRQSGFTFDGGSTTSNGTLSGTIVPGSSISGTFVSDLDSGTFQLTAMTTDYNRPASLATVAGTYAYDSAYLVPPSTTPSVFHTVTTGAADGTGSATTSTGCMNTGSTTSIPNPLHNAYQINVNFTCPPAGSAPTQLTFTALSAFFPAGTGSGILGVGAAAFTVDTTVIITDDVPDQVAYLIISAKQ